MHQWMMFMVPLLLVCQATILPECETEEIPCHPSVEGELPETESEITTTTLAPHQCAQCHDFSVCIEFAYPQEENNTVCNKCACPKGRSGLCCETRGFTLSLKTIDVPCSGGSVRRGAESLSQRPLGPAPILPDGATARQVGSVPRLVDGDISLEMWPCYPNPCKNFGECVEHLDGGFSCECSPQYTGEFFPMKCHPRCYREFIL
uniref:EGF-like domain-containing protein n=1 Tax=Steinernema glaseri TaxID=37863 RepID=A0A1I7YET8_9BILA